MFRSFQHIPTLAILAAALAIPAAALAGPPSPVTTALSIDEDGVPAAELSFDPAVAVTPAGQATLHRAIQRAARRVCNGYFGFDNAPSSCREELVADAESQLALVMANAGGRLYASAR